MRRYRALCDGSLDEGSGLELSMHLPTDPSCKTSNRSGSVTGSLRATGNRFSVLNRMHPSSSRSEDHAIPSRRRRTRNTRAQRDRKRHRDPRGNRRRLLAVRRLDERLSGEFDETLKHANIQNPVKQELWKPSSVLLSTKNTLRSTEAVRDQVPKLPDFGFGFTQANERCPTQATSIELPKAPRPAVPRIPDWCSTFGALLKDYMKPSDMPLYFDLSSLPETVNVPKHVSHDQQVQIWRPKALRAERRHSRFFPPAYTMPVQSRPLRTACALHSSEKEGLRQPTWESDINDMLYTPIAPLPSAPVAYEDKEIPAAYPANLWHILDAPASEVDHDYYNSYEKNLTWDWAANQSDWLDMFDPTCALSELGASELPFVHTNSLTGFANERASRETTCPRLELPAYTPLEQSSTIQELLVGLNELVVDQYMEEEYAENVIAALENLPPLPPSPVQEPATLVSKNALQELPMDIEHEEFLPAYDAHYQSEQALFETSSPADDDIVDIVTFLRTQCAPDCWCEDCKDPPELLPSDSEADEEPWVDFFEIGGRSTPVSPLLLGAELACAFDDDEEDEIWGEWVDFPRCSPSVLAHGPW